jgi:hypothetical protein
MSLMKARQSSSKTSRAFWLAGVILLYLASTARGTVAAANHAGSPNIKPMAVGPVALASSTPMPTIAITNPSSTPTQISTLVPTSNQAVPSAATLTPSKTAQALSTNTPTQIVSTTMTPTPTKTVALATSQGTIHLRRAAVPISGGAPISLVISGPGSGCCPTMELPNCEGGCPCYVEPQGWGYPPTGVPVNDAAPFWCENLDQISIDLITTAGTTNLVLMSPGPAVIPAPVGNNVVSLQKAPPVKVSAHVGDIIQYTYYHTGCTAAATEQEIEQMCFNGGMTIWDSTGSIALSSTGDPAVPWPIVFPAGDTCPAPEFSIQYNCASPPPGDCGCTESNPFIYQWVVVGPPTPTPSVTQSPTESPTFTISPTMTASPGCVVVILKNTPGSPEVTIIKTCTMDTSLTPTPSPSPTISQTTTPGCAAIGCPFAQVGNYKQCGGDWSNDQLDSTEDPGDTICNAGCVLTSFAMVMQQNPGTVNDLFTSTSSTATPIFDPNKNGRLFVDRAATQAGWAAENAVDWNDANSPQQIEYALCHGEIVLVRVERFSQKKQTLGGHTVVVTGEDSSIAPGATSPTCRFTINDPGSATYDHLDSYQRLLGQSIDYVQVLDP